jgi:hypothetical protein
MGLAGVVLNWMGWAGMGCIGFGWIARELASRLVRYPRCLQDLGHYQRVRNHEEPATTFSCLAMLAMREYAELECAVSSCRKTCVHPRPPATTFTSHRSPAPQRHCTSLPTSLPRTHPSPPFFSSFSLSGKFKIHLFAPLHHPSSIIHPLIPFSHSQRPRYLPLA